MDVFGTGPEDIWAVGPEVDGFLHFDGKGWTVVQPCLPDGGRPMTQVFALAQDDVWFAGASWVVHWDGEAWTETQLDPSFYTWSLWGTGPDNLWVRGSCGMDAPCEKGYQWDGESWSREYGRLGLGGTSPDNGWAREAGGGLSHWNGTSWTSLGGAWAPAFLLATAEGYHAVYHHQLLRWSEGTWQPHEGTLTNPPSAEIRAIAQEGADEALAVGGMPGLYSRALAVRWDGSRWESSYVGPPGGLQGPYGLVLTAVDITGPGEAWAGGGIQRWDNGVLHWGGTGWSGPSKQWFMEDVWGAAPDDVWAVTGSGSSLMHYDGAQWSKHDLPGFSIDLLHVQGSSARNVWAVGLGMTWRWDGTSWAQYVAYPEVVRNGLWVGAEDDAWMSADKGRMTHWDGVAWTDVVTGTSAYLGHVTGSGRNDVWAVSGGHGLLHWDGTAWSSHEPPVGMTFYTVSSRAPGEVWVGTHLGILRFAP